jgi:hypothetical protein
VEPSFHPSVIQQETTRLLIMKKTIEKHNKPE